jgi:hypothetical protein
MLEIVIDPATSAGERNLVNRIQQKLGHHSAHGTAYPARRLAKEIDTL